MCNNVKCECNCIKYSEGDTLTVKIGSLEAAALNNKRQVVFQEIK